MANEENVRLTFDKTTSERVTSAVRKLGPMADLNVASSLFASHSFSFTFAAVL